MGKIKYPIIDGTMKECGECHQIKNLSAYHKARKHYCANCKECRKIYAKEYRQRPEIKKKTSLYHKEYKNREGKKDIINARQRKLNKTEKYKNKRNKNRKEWTAREKQKAVDYLGGQCKICGYKKCLAALDFHHLDPSKKEGIKDYRSFENNKSELDKCILLCCRCHRELHWAKEYEK